MTTLLGYEAEDKIRDPTIESLHFDEKDKKQMIHLKFKGKEEIILNNLVEHLFLRVMHIKVASWKVRL